MSSNRYWIGGTWPWRCSQSIALSHLTCCFTSTDTTYPIYWGPVNLLQRVETIVFSAFPFIPAMSIHMLKIFMETFDVTNYEKKKRDNR